MADPKQVELLRQGIKAWNRWRTKHPDLIPDLSRADLSRAELRGANLSRADIRGTNLKEAVLSRANFSEANLSEANLCGAGLGEAILIGAMLSDVDLSRAYLINADLTEANLHRANLDRANLPKANLKWANLIGADLSRANLGDANFSEANLSGATLSGATLSATIFGNTDLTNTGLKDCVHVGPSILDLLTLTKSGPLPLAFLRGCGLPDVFIEYLPSLLNEAIQFQSCFISYSTKDQEFADRLYADLQNKGVRCWFAPHDIQGGKEILEQIDKAIQMQDRVLLLLSIASMKSGWVQTEIGRARKREKSEKRHILFPLRLVSMNALRKWECVDTDTGKDWAKEIRKYYVPDFSKWKEHDCYQKEFERLLKDLKMDKV